MLERTVLVRVLASGNSIISWVMVSITRAICHSFPIPTYLVVMIKPCNMRTSVVYNIEERPLYFFRIRYYTGL
jgi:hypothetical protein